MKRNRTGKNGCGEVSRVRRCPCELSGGSEVSSLLLSLFLGEEKNEANRKQQGGRLMLGHGRKGGGVSRSCPRIGWFGWCGHSADRARQSQCGAWRVRSARACARRKKGLTCGPKLAVAQGEGAGVWSEPVRLVDQVGPSRYNPFDHDRMADYGWTQSVPLGGSVRSGQRGWARSNK